MWEFHNPPHYWLQKYEIYSISQNFRALNLKFSKFIYNFVALLSKYWSKMTIAAIASTMGTARGSTHGS